MKRVCFIGNSHLACIKKAMDKNREADREGISATFFTASASWMSHLRQKNGFLLPVAKDQKEQSDILKWLNISSGGKDRIAFSEYDAFVICGGGFRFVINLLNSYSTREGVPYSVPEHFVSYEFFREIIEARFRYSRAGYKVAKKIRQNTEAPIVIFSEPCTTVEWLAMKGLGNLTSAVGSNFMKELYKDYWESNRSLSNSLNARFVVQPDITLEAPGFTKKHYNKRGIGLAVGTRNEGVYDGMHMNHEYGEMMLKDILL